ncbi:PepSY domain-containing protein [Roseomonas gilardii subsp. gilardii]|uniref:PepSY-associated TM helix domain-containing protein n=1 Tax=Roseomonas gilardii TaxID=257708 RepID=UPI001FFB105D|nr:PepSY-associated TM helix domain-containing protein [Roseomonas gilardii]UPG73419.1 PepSY domain-containing protein [Roseomonas gilardii subsp. gilardii]
MKEGFRQCMAWLHTWSGLLVGWVLFAVFLTGTAAYLRPEISYWMRPEIARSSTSAPDAAIAAVAYLEAKAPRSPAWFITLPDAREGVTRVFWRAPAASGRGFQSELLDPATGQPVEMRKTMGGDFFYRFHFELHYIGVLWGRWIICFCTLFMLVAIVSGVITHRRIFADFFTFRPGKGHRSWLDAHNLGAVLALPFHLMITYTGLVIFMLMLMPWGIDRTYPEGRNAFNAELFGNPPALRPSGQAAPLVPLAPLLEQAGQRWQGGEVGRITVSNAGDASATIQLVRRDADRISTAMQSLLFEGATGKLISVQDQSGAVMETRGVMYGLHLGRFAGPLLRGLFILSGLAGTTMVATGCLLWAVKQRQQAAKKGKPGFGTRLVEHLNLAAIGGLPVAMAAYFWANRLLPADMAGRAEWEIHAFFLAWGACCLHPLLRRGRRGWVEQFTLAALLFAALPVGNLLLGQRPLTETLAAGDWVRVWFDLGLLALGLGLGAIAWKVARHQATPPRRRAAQRRPTAEALPAEAGS